VVIADCLWAKIDSDGGENAVFKIPCQTRVVSMKAAEFFGIFLVKFWRIIPERACSVKSVGHALGYSEATHCYQSRRCAECLCSLAAEPIPPRCLLIA
jgi:hypothetical protein